MKPWARAKRQARRVAQRKNKTQKRHVVHEWSRLVRAALEEGEEERRQRT